MLPYGVTKPQIIGNRHIRKVGLNVWNRASGINRYDIEPVTMAYSGAHNRMVNLKFQMNIADLRKIIGIHW